MNRVQMLMLAARVLIWGLVHIQGSKAKEPWQGSRILHMRGIFANDGCIHRKLFKCNIWQPLIQERHRDKEGCCCLILNADVAQWFEDQCLIHRGCIRSSYTHVCIYDTTCFHWVTYCTFVCLDAMCTQCGPALSRGSLGTHGNRSVLRQDALLLNGYSSQGWVQWEGGCSGLM